MKKFVFVLPLLFTFSLIYGQVEHGLAIMSQGNKKALILPLKKTNPKEVEEAWIKFVKDYKGKTKKNKKTGEIFSDNAEIAEMSSNTVDVYTKVMAKAEDTEMMIWFDLGGAYLSADTHPDQYAVAVSMAEKFQLSVSSAALDDQIETEEGVLKKMTGDLTDLQKDQSNAEADIVKYEQKIEEARQKIQAAIEAQKVKESEIEVQKKSIEVLQTKLKSLK